MERNDLERQGGADITTDADDAFRDAASEAAFDAAQDELKLLAYMLGW
jgi:hypothetical protein